MINRVVRGSIEWAEEPVEALIVRREVKTTMESIGGAWMGRALKYGDYVIHVNTVYMTGWRTNRAILSVYKFNDSRKDIDSEIELLRVDPLSYEDEGHAVAAGIAWYEGRA